MYCTMISISQHEKKLSIGKFYLFLGLLCTFMKKLITYISFFLNEYLTRTYHYIYSEVFLSPFANSNKTGLINIEIDEK